MTAEIVAMTTAHQCFVTTLHLVITASLICPASCAQATSSTFTEISLPMKFFSCAAWASLEVTSWNVSGPVSRLQSPFGAGSREMLDAEKMLAALQGYVGSFMPELVLEGGSGEVTLEIFETENGLTCRFNGQEYEMKPMDKGSK